MPASHSHSYSRGPANSPAASKRSLAPGANGVARRRLAYGGTVTDRAPSAFPNKGILSNESVAAPTCHGESRDGPVLPVWANAVVAFRVYERAGFVLAHRLNRYGGTLDRHVPRTEAFTTTITADPPAVAAETAWCPLCVTKLALAPEIRDFLGGRFTSSTALRV